MPNCIILGFLYFNQIVTILFDTFYTLVIKLHSGIVQNIFYFIGVMCFVFPFVFCVSLYKRGNQTFVLLTFHFKVTNGQ